MRDIIVIILILAMIIGGSIWTHNFYETTLNEFSQKLEELAQTIDSDINKEEKINEIEDLWKEKENILIIFQDHSSIGEIESNLYECFQYYRYNEKDHFDAVKEHLIMEMDDLIKREEFTVVNIF